MRSEEYWEQAESGCNFTGSKETLKIKLAEKRAGLRLFPESEA